MADQKDRHEQEANQALDGDGAESPAGDAEDDGADDGPPAHLSEPGVSRLAPRWWLKTLAFAVVLIGFGVWGLVDALVVYPNRGIADAERKQLEYLRAWSQTARTSAATVADPAAELARLRAMSGGGATPLSSLEQARQVWLVALSRVSRLSPEHTTIEDPAARLGELETTWRTRTAPAPLAAYDIPSQWVFVAIGFSIGPWLLYRFLVVSGKKYRWSPDGQVLTVPGGHEVSPADLEDIDKRRWDKFIVFLKVKQGHKGLGGQEVKVDLFHYDQRLEDWVLAMERTAFPDRAKEDEEDEASDATTDESKSQGREGVDASDD